MFIRVQHLDASKSTLLTPEEKYALLNMLNELKNTISLGKMGFESPANATVVIWDDELEAMVGMISKYYGNEDPEDCIDTVNRKNNINDFLRPDEGDSDTPIAIIETTKKWLKSKEYM